MNFIEISYHVSINLAKLQLLLLLELFFLSFSSNEWTNDEKVFLEGTTQKIGGSKGKYMLINLNERLENKLEIIRPFGFYLTHRRYQETILPNERMFY